LASHAEGHKVRAIAALSPSYFKPNSVMELIDAMAAIASAASQTPFYFYDIPGMTQVRLSMPEFLEHAPARIPNLAGLKFTNEDFTSLQRCLYSNEGRWNILWGVDEALLGALSFGVLGAVGSSYNFAAPIYQRVMAAFAVGDWETARHEQFRAVEIIQLLASFGYLPAAKRVMDWLGVPVGGTRLPLKNLSDEQAGRLQVALQQIGFFDSL
jgi:N-acetylneuraminate lyase